jgi:hypothetical protein
VASRLPDRRRNAIGALLRRLNSTNAGAIRQQLADAQSGYERRCHHHGCNSVGLI